MPEIEVLCVLFERYFSIFYAISSQHVEWLEYFPSEIQLYHPVRHYSTKMVCHRRFWKELEEKA